MTEHAQIIRDASGKPAFAVLPIAEYLRLLDAADEALAIHAFDVYDRSRPETFPEALAERLLSGDHPVRVFREHRGLTPQQLADAAGLQAADVAHIEDGAPIGGDGVLERLAAALQVDPTDLA